MPPMTRAEVKREWEDGGAAWAQFEPLLMHALSPVDVPLLRALELAPGQRVLDVGSGPGEPALAIARWVAPRGHVTGLDVSRTMVALARRRARVGGLRNVRFVRGDLERWDAPRAFDRIVSRYGVMFVQDVDDTMARLARSLRARGRLAFAVWGPPERNAYFTMTRALSMRYVPGPLPDPSTVPGPMRFADPASLQRSLRRAGLRRVTVEGVEAPMTYPSVDALVQSIPRISAILRHVVPELSAAARARLVQRIRRGAAPFVDGSVVRFPGFAWIVSASR